MNLTDLQSFSRVVELGTIAAAASEEGVPRSTITRRIARLEEALDVELLRRAPRSFSVTDDGMTLHRLSAAALRELQAAEQAMSGTRQTPHGTLVVSVPDIARSDVFADLLVRYRDAYPAVSVELRVENRVVDLIREGVDVCMRAHVRTLPGSAELMSRTYELPPMAFYASPGWLAGARAPTRPEQLLEHPMVLHTAGVGVPKTLVDGDTQVEVDLGEPAVRANDSHMVRALTEADAGIGMLSMPLANRAVAQGRLVRVLPRWTMRAGRIAVVWPSSRHLAPRVRAFLDLLHESYA